MAEREERDWSNVVSGQIAVYKTDKALLELMDNLKPASYLFPAHIHASGDVSEVGERSLIRLNMLDYSKGTGDNTVSVYANISPEEAKYIYSALFNHLWEFDYPQEKIFGNPDKEGYSIVTKLNIVRYDTDSQGNKRNYPWFVEIQNGRGIAMKNSNGGRYCKRNSYICDKKASLYINDKDLFILFCKTDAYIRAFEMEYAFRENRIGNFTSLYGLLKNEIQGAADRLLTCIHREDEEPMNKAG